MAHLFVTKFKLKSTFESSLGLTSGSRETSDSVCALYFGALSETVAMNIAGSLSTPVLHSLDLVCIKVVS